MLECAQTAIDGWKPGSTLLLQDELTEVTVRIITRCVLGADEGEEREERLRHLVTDWLHSVLTPGLFAFGSLVGLNKMRRYLERKTDERLEESHGMCPYPGRKSTGLKAEFMRMLIEDVERCRSEGIGNRDDVLARVSAASYEGEGMMNIRTVVDQLTLLFSAGHETTAKSIGWILRDITERPTLAAQLKAEVEEHFGDRAIEPLKCRELPLLNSVIRESMRLTPVTTMVQREITEPIEIRDHTLATGTVVAPSNYLAHRHADFWERPDEFIPDRFIGLKPPPYVYFPFGGGGRKCLGATFAEFEMPILLAPILRRVDLSAVPDVEITPVYGGVTLGPSDGLPMKVDAVRGRAS
jgi:cytochrome P450